jgi:hypothetical protein
MVFLPAYEVIQVLVKLVRSVINFYDSVGITPPSMASSGDPEVKATVFSYVGKTFSFLADSFK